MKRYIWAFILIAVLVGVVVYFFYDPSAEGWFPKCRLYQLTGYKCPGCGSQRMLHSLLHLDFVAAFHYNAYLLTVFPVVMLLLIWEGWHKWVSRKMTDMTVYVIVVFFFVSTILWWILRNIFNW